MSKIIPVIFLILILGVGYVAWNFWNQTQALTAKNAQLEKDKTSLEESVSTWRRKYDSSEKEKNELSQRMSTMSAQLSRLEEERNVLGDKLDEVSRQRDMLVEKIKQPAQAGIVAAEGVPTATARAGGGIPEEYWTDFVEKKAFLEAQVDKLNKELSDANSRITRFDKEAKELSIKMDQLTKEKERLEDDIKFKERALRVMSMDLVSEREERGIAVAELKKLRNENVSLKREIVLGNKEKLKLQTNLKDTLEKKDGLETRLMEIDNVLKEKSLAFEEMQDRLERAIKEGKRVVASESASVELPPIVVKPDFPGLKGLRGEIIAVNPQEQFAVVDIGESSGVRPGTMFKVMRGDTEIATLEIVETRREISAADIKEVLGGFTIQEGDIVISR